MGSRVRGRNAIGLEMPDRVEVTWGRLDQRQPCCARGKTPPVEAIRHFEAVAAERDLDFE